VCIVLRFLLAACTVLPYSPITIRPAGASPMSMSKYTVCVTFGPRAPVPSAISVESATNICPFGECFVTARPCPWAGLEFGVIFSSLSAALCESDQKKRGYNVADAPMRFGADGTGLPLCARSSPRRPTRSYNCRRCDPFSRKRLVVFLYLWNVSRSSRLPFPPLLSSRQSRHSLRSRRARRSLCHLCHW